MREVLLLSAVLLLCACQEQAPTPIQPAATLDVARRAAAGAESASGRKIYEIACASCHAAGVAGAPRLGDREAWAERLGAGRAALLQSALNGKGTMPPKGGAAGVTEAEVETAVDFMLEQSR